jgi:SAM-dependent methyltransferase
MRMSDSEPDYHPFVFRNGKFVGKFEEMYQQVKDPWHQQQVATGTKYDLILALTQRRSYATVLDVGSALGMFTNRLRRSQPQANLAAIDVSQTAVARAKQAYPEIDFRAMDILAGLSFRDDSFDLIMMLEVLWYVLGDVDRVMNELARVLAPGGHICIALDMPENPVGREIISNADDLIRLVSQFFEVLEIVHFQDRAIGSNNYFVFAISRKAAQS